MTKFAKMSLVAALAIAGTTASAQPLAEAIKNVDVSGTVVYRYNDYNGEATSKVDGTKSSSTKNHYKVATSLKSKVTDDVTFNSRFIVGGDDGGFVALDTQNGGDANVDVELSWANFAYTGIANTTVIVGKQGIATPWTKATDSDGSEQTGTGILAMTSMGPVTAAAGYFNQTNFATQNDVMVAALLGSFGPVNAEAWYLDVEDEFDGYFVKASGNIDLDAVKLGLFAQYSELDEDGNSKELELFKAGISAKMGIFGASYKYAQTGDDGSSIINTVAPNSAIGWSVSMHNNPDAKGHFVNVNAQVMPKLNIALNYNKVSADVEGADNAAGDEKEFYTQITYNHAKNLSAYIRLGKYEFTDSNDDRLKDNRGRLQVEYKF